MRISVRNPCLEDPREMAKVFFSAFYQSSFTSWRASTPLSTIHSSMLIILDVNSNNVKFGA